MGDDAKPRAPKRVALNMKATPALRAAIEAAAGESGLSIAQEVERRLMVSLAEDERSDTPEEAAFFRNARRVMDRVSQDMGVDWPRDRDAWKLVRSGLLYLLAQIEPEQGETLDAGLSTHDRETIEAFDVSHKEWRARQYAAGVAAGEAHLALHAAEGDQERIRVQAAIAAVEAASAEPEPRPDLSESSLAIWQRLKDRQTLIERATNGLVAVIPSPRR